MVLKKLHNIKNHMKKECKLTKDNYSKNSATKRRHFLNEEHIIIQIQIDMVAKENLSVSLSS